MSYTLKNRLLVLLILISSPLLGMTAKLGLGQKLRSRLATTSSNLANKIKPKTSTTVSLSKTNKQPEAPTKIDRLPSNKIEHIYALLKNSCKFPLDLVTMVIPYLSTEEIDTRLPVILLAPTYKLHFTKSTNSKNWQDESYRSAGLIRGSLAFTVNTDHTVTLWDTATGNKKHILPHSNKVNAVDFSKDGSLLATGSKDKVIIWNTETGEVVRTLTGEAINTAPNQDEITSVRFNEAGTQIIAAGLGANVIIWDIKTGAALHTFNSNETRQWHLSITKENSHAISVSYDKAFIWDLKKTDKPLHILEHKKSDCIEAIKFNNANTYIVTRNRSKGDNSAKLWDIKTGKLIHTFPHNSWVNSTEFSTDDRYLITGSSDKTAKIWHVSSGELIHTLKHHALVNFAQFNNDNSCAITSSSDSNPIIWDTETGTTLVPLALRDFLDKVILHSDGDLALATGDYRYALLLQAPSLNFNQLLLLSRIHTYAHDSNKQFSFDMLAQAYNQDPKDVLKVWLTFSEDLRIKISQLYKLNLPRKI